MEIGLSPLLFKMAPTWIVLLQILFPSPEGGKKPGAWKEVTTSKTTLKWLGKLMPFYLLCLLPVDLDIQLALQKPYPARERTNI